MIFMERLRDWLEEYGDDEEIDNFIEGNYFYEDGCVSDDWIGDDLNEAITTKFYYPYRTVVDILSESIDIEIWFSIYIQPSYESASVILVTARKPDDKDEDYLVLKDFRKAWNFNFKDKAELEEEMQEIYDIIKENLRKKGLINK